MNVKLFKTNVDSANFRENLLIFGLGTLTGFSVRALIYADYWWFFIVLLALCCAIVLRNKRLKDENDALRSRLEEAEKLVSQSVILIEQPQSVERAQRVPDSHREEVPKETTLNLPLFSGLRDMGTSNPKRRKVRLTQILGKGAAQPQTPVVGIEDLPPEEGKEYRVLTDRGSLFQTSIVIKVAPGYIKTENAFYELAVIEEN
jgi:hypothetical protein